MGLLPVTMSLLVLCSCSPAQADYIEGKLKFLTMTFNEVSSDVLLNLYSADGNPVPRRINCTLNSTGGFPADGLPTVQVPSSFSSQFPVKVYAHGFTSHPHKDLRNAWIDMANKTGTGINVIMVDWAELCHLYELEYITLGWDKFFAPYSLAARHAIDVGTYLGACLASMAQNHQLDLDQLHLVGHSLGAHLVGKAGRTITKLTNKKASRATGLDPAGPKFVKASSKGALRHFLKRDPQLERINQSTAHFVDIIHTNGVTEPGALPPSYGYLGRMGHVDFFPNGGSVQPPPKHIYCLNREWSLCIPHLDVWPFKQNDHNVNSHSLANTYFIQSLLNGEEFKSKTCSHEVCPVCRREDEDKPHDDHPVCHANMTEAAKAPLPLNHGLEVLGSCYMGDKATDDACTDLLYVPIDCSKTYLDYEPYCATTTDNKVEL